MKHPWRKKLAHIFVLILAVNLSACTPPAPRLTPIQSPHLDGWAAMWYHRVVVPCRSPLTHFRC